MKSNFIIKFLKAVVDSGKDIHEVWQWESISYKGWKVPIIGLQRVLVVDFESETRYEEGQTTVRAPKQSRVGDYPSYLTLRDDGSLDMA